jgi:hypothetical protein
MEDKRPVSTKPRISSASPPAGARPSPLLGCSEDFGFLSGVDLHEKKINANSNKTIFNCRILKITFILSELSFHFMSRGIKKLHFQKE